MYARRLYLKDEEWQHIKSLGKGVLSHGVSEALKICLSRKVTININTEVIINNDQCTLANKICCNHIDCTTCPIYIIENKIK